MLSRFFQWIIVLVSITRIDVLKGSAGIKCSQHHVNHNTQPSRPKLEKVGRVNNRIRVFISSGFSLLPSSAATSIRSFCWAILFRSFHVSLFSNIFIGEVFSTFIECSKASDPGGLWLTLHGRCCLPLVFLRYEGNRNGEWKWIHKHQLHVRLAHRSFAECKSSVSEPSTQIDVILKDNNTRKTILRSKWCRLLQVVYSIRYKACSVRKKRKQVVLNQRSYHWVNKNLGLSDGSSQCRNISHVSNATHSANDETHFGFKPAIVSSPVKHS